MTDPKPASTDPVEDADEFDTEGQAFTWTADPKDSRKLRQSWTPDDPKDVKASRDMSSSQRKTDSRR